MESDTVEFIMFKILFLPKYRVQYYDYNCKVPSGAVGYNVIGVQACWCIAGIVYILALISGLHEPRVLLTMAN